MKNYVYIATSLDGYIADKNNNIDWLHETPNPEGSDMGYSVFMSRIDALVMGRNTYEKVMSFDCDWPYHKPVFVLSNTMTTVAPEVADKVFIVSGELEQVVNELNQKGFNELYIDGGVTIQNFLKQDLIDELIITTIPTLLGGGISLFGELAAPLKFKHISSQQHLGCLVTNSFIRVRES
ncbi:dihydrofolate reductase family protein [Shewanella electrodiphila]|uniref:Dihydrofolate reductase family protein n=1 Tax=Shewanella electrodiphila TaxID=934143 RepID=A0ABT0KTH1_9GAMM|nr:dihydrofolate reductase family protein [Shewanella electrodiphila]MCL1047063.1 dihydrofolate reductase family protein [Shewanella electrodiphila]